MSDISAEALDYLESVIDAKIDNATDKVGKTTHQARVMHTDDQGVTWVSVPGISEQLPVDRSLIEVVDNMDVTASIDNGDLVIEGSTSDPAVSGAAAEDIAQGTSRNAIYEALGLNPDELQTLSVANIIADFVQAETASLEKAMIQYANIHQADIDFANVNIASIKQAIVDEFVARSATADALKAQTADIDNLYVRAAQILSLVAGQADIDKLKAKDATIEDLFAADATINRAYIFGLLSDNATIQDLVAGRANIDYANIISQQGVYAALQQMMVQSGWFEFQNVGEAQVGYLKAVHIDANDVEIEHLKVKDLYLYDDTAGEDGLWYQLNMLGGQLVYSDLSPELQAEVKAGLHGDNIIAGTVTADKIFVQDLAAFKATIAGMVFDQIEVGDEKYYTMHTFGKDSVNNNTPGIYVDQMGQVAIGTGSSYVMLYRDVDGTWKMRLNADQITMGGQSLASTIKTLQDQVDNVVETWFHDGAPTLNEGPSASWTTAEDQAKHLGDVCYDNLTGDTYRFSLDGSEYKWILVAEGVTGIPGPPGTDGYFIQIQSSNGTTFVNGDETTELTCRLYQGGSELDSDGTYLYEWSRQLEDGIADPSFSATGKTVTVSAADVVRKAVYSCSVTF